MVDVVGLGGLGGAGGVALTAATGGDLSPLERLLDAVDAPYHERPGLEAYAAPAPPDSGAYRTFCGT